MFSSKSKAYVTFCFTSCTKLSLLVDFSLCTVLVNNNFIINKR